jgi:DUF3102 family protein
VNNQDHTRQRSPDATALEAAQRVLYRPAAIRKLDDDKLLDFIRSETDAIGGIVVEAWNAARPRAISLGTAFIEARRRFGGHGKWLPWIEKNLPFGKREAQRYMRIAKHSPKALPEPTSKTKATRVALLSVRALEAMVAEPKPAKAKQVSAKPIAKVTRTTSNEITDVVIQLGALFESLDPETSDELLLPELERIVGLARTSATRAAPHSRTKTTRSRSRRKRLSNE